MKDKFDAIQPWIPLVLATIKNEIKTEHLPKSPAFARVHFGSRPFNRLTFNEIADAYQKALLGGDSSLAEWVINRWVFKNGDLYSFFAEKLGEISSDFSEIAMLTEEESDNVLKGSVEQFGVLSVYLFSILNEVAFPETVFNRLRVMVEKEDAERQLEEKLVSDRIHFQRTEENYQRDLARMHSKYEAKYAGMVKKYSIDVEALKKQIRSLQKQLNGDATQSPGFIHGVNQRES